METVVANKRGQVREGQDIHQGRPRSPAAGEGEVEPTGWPDAQTRGLGDEER